MNPIHPLRSLLLAVALGASALQAWSQVIELRATINAAQETTPSNSPATGSAIMLYDIGTNRFDLIVSIRDMTNTASSSHIHEAAAGSAGGPVATLGGESAYTRSGNTLTATFRDVTYGGDRLKLIRGGAYYNIHSGQYPDGEIRGQLMPQPVRLVANIDVAQEQAALPNVNLSGVNDFGAAILLYDPVAHAMRLRLSLFNFTNTFSNSHIHAAAPGVSGGVVHGLGNLTVAGYNTANGHVAGSFDVPMAATTDPIVLLTGGTYLNFHSTAFTGGEARGQLRVADDSADTRLANISVRGFVGTGDQVLIQGFHITGPNPIRVLVTAKGPSLGAFGVAGGVANPVLALHDAAGRQIALNDNVGTPAAGSELAGLTGVPGNANESALLVVLPPGNYTAIVSAAAGTGIALLEITELRILGSTTATGVVW